MSATSIMDQQIAAYNLVRQCNDKSTICHAAARAMYFGRDGIVGACCVNRVATYGAWPQKSVHELWFDNQSRLKLHEALAQNTLPQGCDRCAEQLRAGSFVALQARGYDGLAKATPVQPDLAYPTRMDFELSNKCNLECIQCSGFYSSSIRSNRENLPTLPASYDTRLIEQLRPFIPHLEVAKFLGGEPFLIDLYYDIWELFIELNPRCIVTIITNGTVFTAKAQRVLEKLNCDVFLSIDSLQKETYEHIRRNGVFERTLANVESIRAINRSHGRSTALSVSPMLANWREMPGLIAWATERDMHVYFTTVTNPKELSLRNASPALLDEVVETYAKVPCISGSPLAEHNNQAFNDLRNLVTMWRSDRETIHQIEHAWEDLVDIQTTPTLTTELSDVEIQRAQLRGRCRALANRLPNDVNPATRSLILALSEEFPDLTDFKANLEFDGTRSPFERISSYLTSIWEVGEMLSPYGVLPDANFDKPRLAAYLDFHQRAFSPRLLNQVYEFTVNRPYVVLSNVAVGSLDDMYARLTKFLPPDLNTQNLETSAALTG